MPEIEAEISQIELTNLLTAQLRKRHPESYRLARRVSTLIQSSEAFKRFDNIGNEEIHRRLADRVYGLASWGDTKVDTRPTGSRGTNQDCFIPTPRHADGWLHG